MTDNPVSFQTERSKKYNGIYTARLYSTQQEYAVQSDRCDDWSLVRQCAWWLVASDVMRVCDWLGRDIREDQSIGRIFDDGCGAGFEILLDQIVSMRERLS